MTNTTRVVFIIVLLMKLNVIWGSNNPRTIHVFVALCDNENQGIVPVPELIGNGQDPYNNLYWGAGYGVKNYFHKKSDNWVLIKSYKNPFIGILERVVFKNEETNTYLVADAFDGAAIEQTTLDFLYASSGQIKGILEIDNKTLHIGGSADLIAYIGHNGLMDFDVQEEFTVDSSKVRDIIILACYSKSFFKEFLKEFNVNPLVWSTGLMSAEAYTLKWAIDGWLINESNDQIVQRAREAYNHYQKCGIKGASNLLTTGF